MKLLVEAMETVGVAHARVLALPLPLERLRDGSSRLSRHRRIFEILGGADAPEEHGADSWGFTSCSPLPGAAG